MSLYKIQVTRSVRFNGVAIEPGMSVEVVDQLHGYSNPMSIAGNRKINDAFMRKYGIDLDRAGLLSPNYLRIVMEGCATSTGLSTSSEEHREMTKKESWAAIMLNLFS